MKLDYDLLFLRIVTLGGDALEVVVKEVDGRTIFADFTAYEVLF